MSGKSEDTRPLFLHERHSATGDRANDMAAEPAEERELKALLEHWQTPRVPQSLDHRVMIAYRQHLDRVPQREEEKMKRCSTCQEEFADKFSFCPVDGTPLHGLSSPVSEPEPEITPTIAHTPDPPTTTQATAAAATLTAPAAPSPEQASAPAAPPVPAIAAAATAAEPTISAAAAQARGEYHLTILEDEGLLSRLTKEMREVAHESQLTWPEFKRNPLSFSKRLVVAYTLLLRRFFAQENVGLAILASLVAMIALAGAVILLDRAQARHLAEVTDSVREDLVLTGMLTEIPEEQKKPEEGPAGMNKGKGGGAKPKQEKPGGGGGGGRQEAKPASVGKLPQASLTIPQVVAPNPRPPVIKNPSLPTPATIVADPVLFPPDTRPIAYGDPKSKATETSAGPGTGNGIGTGSGGGVGSGEGGGVGPGRGGNTGGGDRHDGGGGPGGGGGGGDPNRVFKTGEVTRRVTILSKPEPSFTEEARKNNVTGEVVLRVIFSSSGQVTNIVPIKRLPDGLTEKAIAAARQIKFVPAEKDGRPVSVYGTIAYNFNIY